MRGLVLTAVLALALGANEARAQSTTGTISGRVVDSQNLALPGVTVTATSPNLQGERDAVTTTTGDYRDLAVAAGHVRRDVSASRLPERPEDRQPRADASGDH